MDILTEFLLTSELFGRSFRSLDVKAVEFCLPAAVFPALCCSVAISGRTLGVELKQSALGDHQIRQAEQRHQLCGVLGQPSVTSLLQTEAIFDDVKGMFDLSANTGLDRFHLVAQAVNFAAHFQRPTLASSESNLAPMWERERPSLIDGGFWLKA